MFPKIGENPQNGWFKIMENPMNKWMIWVGKNTTPIFGWKHPYTIPQNFFSTSTQPTQPTQPPKSSSSASVCFRFSTKSALASRSTAARKSSWKVAWERGKIPPPGWPFFIISRAWLGMEIPPFFFGRK